MILEVTEDGLKKDVKALNQMIAHRVDKLMDRVYRSHIPDAPQSPGNIMPNYLPPQLPADALRTVEEDMDTEMPEEWNEMTVEEERAVQYRRADLEATDQEAFNEWEQYDDDVEEVSQVRWIPLHRNSDGRKVDSHFQTRTADNRLTKLVTEEWVGSWMSVIFFETCKRLPLTWLHVPAGNSREDLAPAQLLSSEKVHYPQGRRALCMLKSLASAMFYVGLRKESGMINSLSKAYENIDSKVAFEKLREAMKEKAPTIGIGVAYNLPWAPKNRKRKKHKRLTLEELVDMKTIYPTLIIPLGADGQVSHAVCVVDDLIFDSTQPWALHLCKESLDWVCGQCGARDIYLAVRFKHSFGKKVPQLQRNMIYHSNVK